MNITALVPTHHLPEESVAWISEVQNTFNEVIVLIDQKRATPGTLVRAEKVASRVVFSKREAWYDPERFALLAECNSEWIFVLEYDEQLSPEWQQQDEWRRILETTQFTHFWVPRRWIVPGQFYIAADPWWPDLQMRLFQNNLKGTTFPLRLHDSIYVPGQGACFTHLAIHHHVLWLSPRKAREDKERHYKQLRPGGALGHYYLYEDYQAPQAALPAAVPLDISREVISMDKLLPEELSRISLEVGGVPREVSASTMFWSRARITNGLDRALTAGAPRPVRLSYHWLEKSTRQSIVFDGIRSGFFPGLSAGDTMQCAMTILAPGQPGEYILQTTMVQEGVCWFETVRPDIIQEFDVSVRAELPGTPDVAAFD